jgi:hypothetical protein
MKLWNKKEKQTIQKTDDYLILGHMIKYNLYLLSKSIIFSSVVNKTNTLADAISLTNEVIGELDLASKESKKDS